MKTERFAGRLRRLARGSGISKAAKSTLRRFGFHLIRDHYYSPIPTPSELPAELWANEADLPGVDFDAADGLDFIQRELAPHIAEYTAPSAPTGSPRDFYLDNGFYDSVDAETLYAMVRRFAPTRIIELGSGMSTLVMADARAQNEGGDDASHTVYDPFPREDLLTVQREVADVHLVSATDVPLSAFEQLRSGDLLFVDTTHTVKTGGDVNRIILDVLPMLAPGVYVHLHDIFLPWEYPRDFLTERNFYWAEQYLLQSFLAFNPEFEIVFGAYSLQRRYQDAISRLIPSARPDTCPTAFWLRRVER
jgi:Methyltransferase domain